MALTSLHIKELIALCKKNDQPAQMELYKRYYKAMYNTALRIIKNNAEAEDVMQEAFLTAFTKLSVLKDEQLFGAWLKKIVINASLSFIKKKEAKMEVSLEKVTHRIGNQEDIVEENLEVIKAKEIVNAITELKQNYSIALSLHLIEGYDYEEIAGIMNISYANCRTLVSRAKESLRKQLKPA